METCLQLSHGRHEPVSQSTHVLGSEKVHAQEEYTRIDSIMEISAAVEVASVDERKTEVQADTDLANVRTELECLLQLAFPMVVTCTLEILPDIVSVILVSHIRSPDTPMFVDGAMLSIMVRGDHIVRYQICLLC